MTDKWTPEKANDWYASIEPIRGCNYLAAQRRQLDRDVARRESFDPATIAEELAWAAAAGFNGVRVFPSVPRLAERPGRLEAPH